MISRALRMMKDLSVAEVWQRAGRSDSGARENKFYRFASACVQRNGAHPDLLEPRLSERGRQAPPDFVGKSLCRGQEKRTMR